MNKIIGLCVSVLLVFSTSVFANYSGDAVLELTKLVGAESDEVLLNKSNELVADLIDQFELSSSRKARLEDINPQEVVQSGGDYDPKIPIDTKAIIVNGDAKLLFVSNSIIIVSGSLKISRCSNCIIVSGEDINLSQDGSKGSGSLIVSNGGIDVHRARNSSMYAVGGVIISEPKNVALYNTKKYLTHWKVPVFSMPPLFENEPHREYLTNDNIIHNHGDGYDRQMINNRREKEKTSRTSATNVLINKTNLDNDDVKNSLPIPSISNRNLKEFEEGVRNKVTCSSDQIESLRGTSNTCIRYMNYESNYDVNWLWIVVGSKHEILGNAFGEVDPDKHFRKLSALFDYYENDWGTSRYRKSWKSGKLRILTEKYLGEYKDFEVIADALAGCTILMVEVLSENASVQLVRDKSGHVKPTPSNNIVRKYDHETIYEKYIKTPNTKRQPYKITSCLDPNNVTRF